MTDGVVMFVDVLELYFPFVFFFLIFSKFPNCDALMLVNPSAFLPKPTKTDISFWNLYIHPVLV